NNGYGLSTPSSEQYRCKRLADKGIGYGMESVQIDGNNILDVYDTVKGVREFCIREQKPYLIECMTFRMRGHEEASGTKYIPAELFELWGKKDPVVCYESWLKEEGLLDEGRVNEIRGEFRTVIENAIAVPQHPVLADTKKETEDMYAQVPEHSGKVYTGAVDTEAAPVKRYIDGIRDGLWQAMEENENLILMGQDIAE